MACSRIIPDNAHCAVLRSGVADLCYCLVPNPEHCPYCEQFRFRYFCFHPDRLEMADRFAVKTSGAK